MKKLAYFIKTKKTGREGDAGLRRSVKRFII
jgi:hypothetical protein